MCGVWLLSPCDIEAQGQESQDPDEIARELSNPTAALASSLSTIT